MQVLCMWQLAKVVQSFPPLILLPQDLRRDKSRGILYSGSALRVLHARECKLNVKWHQSNHFLANTSLQTLP
jgi:hypothetical protein